MILKDQKHFRRVHRTMVALSWCGKVSAIALGFALYLALPFWHAVALWVLLAASLAGMGAAVALAQIKETVHVSNLVHDTQRLLRAAIEERNRERVHKEALK